jgi:hypothetical protein
MPFAEPVITAVRFSRFIALVIISRLRANAGYCDNFFRRTTLLQVAI